MKRARITVMSIVVLTALASLSWIAIRAASAGGEAKPSISLVQMKVYANNDEWQKVPGIMMETGDMLFLRAEGEVQMASGMLGKYMAGAAGASTHPKNKLTVKIGKSFKEAFPAVDYAIMNQDKKGSVKLRFHDTDYTDNTGEFKVTILHIPGSLIPPLQAVEAEVD